MEDLLAEDEDIVWIGKARPKRPGKTWDRLTEWLRRLFYDRRSGCCAWCGKRHG